MSDLRINATDNSGDFNAYVARPKILPAPTLIVIQEIFGVNQVMRDICEGYARRGYIAICPDLFWRQEPGIQLTDKTQGEWDRAFELRKGFDENKGVEDLAATLAAARKLDDSTGKAGALGFCLGGQMAYLMATRTDIDCAVSYYGVGIEGLLNEAGNIRAPLMMHIAEEDKFVSPDAQQQIKDALLAHTNIFIHSYPGVNHAFARKDGEHYNDDAARIAAERTQMFLEDHLKQNISSDKPLTSNV